MQARYKKAVMWALYALLMLTVFVIQGVVFGRTRYFGTKLSLLPVALACIGLLILLCTLCAVAVGYLCDRYLNRNFLSALMMSLLTLIVMQGLLFLFKRYLGQTGEEGWSILLKQIGLSMLACPPAYLAAWAIGKVGK